MPVQKKSGNLLMAPRIYIFMIIEICEKIDKADTYKGSSSNVLFIIQKFLRTKPLV